jgi:hypothetical protein
MARRSLATEEPQVCWNLVARRQQNDVAGHQCSRGKALFAATTQDGNFAFY